MVRSEVRHALYRMKNGVPIESKKHIYDLIEPLIPPGQTWQTFSTGWDVFVEEKVGTDGITVIIPEIDYDFIHTTCLEKSFCAQKGIKFDATPRQANVIQIVDLSMLEGKMTWETYNKAWGVSVDRELKRISTRLFITNINVVTPEMIEASKKSDGTAMIDLPTIPKVEMSDPVPMSEAEKIAFLDSLATQKKSQARKKKT